jgi:hypothetical protein
MKNIVRQLLKQGVEVNVRSGQYGCALHAALAGNHEDIARLLIENGADVKFEVSHILRNEHWLTWWRTGASGVVVLFGEHCFYATPARGRHERACWPIQFSATCSSRRQKREGRADAHRYCKEQRYFKLVPG